VPSSNGRLVVITPKVTALRCARRKRARSISETGEEHQQQFSKIRKEVCDRSLLAEHVERMRAQDHPAEQQAALPPAARGASTARGRHDNGHADGELRERRQCQPVDAEKFKGVCHLNARTRG
jgi:hypothetical protein